MTNRPAIDPIYGEDATEQEDDHLDIAAGNDVGEPDPEDTTLDPTHTPDVGDEEDKKADEDE